jgi:hypothetical protein
MLKKLLRFKNLKERGYVTSRNQLRVLIKRCGFPPGRRISDRIVTWEEDAVADWYLNRPVADGPVEPDPPVDLNNNTSNKSASITPTRKAPSHQARYGPPPDTDTTELHDP